MSIQSERKSFTGRLSRQVLIAVGLTTVAAVSCQRTYQKHGALVVTPPPSVAQPLPPNASPQLKQFVEAAIEQSKVTTGYDPSVGIGKPVLSYTSDYS